MPLSKNTHACENIPLSDYIRQLVDTFRSGRDTVNECSNTPQT